MDRLFTPVKRQNRACAGAHAAWRFAGLAGPRRGRGFTLVELVVTMIVIGILAVVVVPKFSLLGGFDEVGYRDKVKAAIEFARKAAVAQRRYACVDVSANAVTLTIEAVEPENVGHTATCPYASGLSLPAPDKSCVGGATNKVCPPANVTLVPAGATPQYLLFSPLGRPALGASYTLTGDSIWTIKVEAESGYVHHVP